MFEIKWRNVCFSFQNRVRVTRRRHSATAASWPKPSLPKKVEEIKVGHQVIQFTSKTGTSGTFYASKQVLLKSLMSSNLLCSFTEYCFKATLQSFFWLSVFSLKK
jgi:hypothetical protein